MEARYHWKQDPARSAALAARAIHYDGRPCRRCDSVERYVSSGNCVHCTKSLVAQRAVSSRTREAIPLEPDDSRCQCCGDINRLTIDHDHELEALGFPAAVTFRGWVCYACNQGLGRLGDNIAGLQRALDYLTKAANRI